MKPILNFLLFQLFALLACGAGVILFDSVLQADPFGTLAGIGGVSIFFWAAWHFLKKSLDAVP